MPRIRLPCILRACCSGTLLRWAAGAQTSQSSREEARALVRRVETQYQGETSHAVSRMRVVTERWTREMTPGNVVQGTRPVPGAGARAQKGRGVASLKIGEEMWNFLPNIDRLMKIPSSMMGESWMGSHLTNDDLVKEDQVDKLYTLSMTRRRKISRRSPASRSRKPPWCGGRFSIRSIWIGSFPLSTRYYDESGALVRTITFDDVQQISGTWIPMRMRVQPQDKPKEQTVFEYQKLDFNVRLSG